MAKRSPILGYNHNVLYRGLVFHVQTEDSGLLSPHLFTHLFHGGVILSTRKLVYDAGSAEDAIKGLMQSQHKIVLKDLKRGAFDDKIDQYLVGTPGLLPRTTPLAPAETAVPARASAPEVPVPPPDEGLRSTPEIILTRPGTEELDQADAIDLIDDQPSAPQIIIEQPPPPVVSRTATPPPIPRASTPLAVPARTQTAERKSAPTAVRTHLAPAVSPDELDPPTDPDVDSGAIVAAINATVKTPMVELDSAPEISIKLDLEEPEGPDSRTRTKHDTDVQMPFSDGVPGPIGGVPERAQRGADSVPPPPTTPERKTGDRAAVAAGALPPARPISRPPSRQAITPPAVVSRPVAQEDRSDAGEIYAAAPADSPAERAERPGQYAQHKKPSGRLPVDVIKNDRERPGSVPIPSGLSRPGRTQPALPVTPPRPNPPSQPPAQARTATPPSGPLKPPTQPIAVPRPHPPSAPPPQASRTTTPSRVSPPSGNAPQSRAGGSGGVVMTRPAVIVGAPAKPTTPPRVRKAREEEGRGFGQGLISEKSLDEVILAYLSEDADDK